MTEKMETEEQISRADDSKSKKRVLAIYDRLLQNRPVARDELITTFGVNKRTIERDIRTINDFLKEKSLLDFPVDDEESIARQLAGEDSEEALWGDVEDDLDLELPSYRVKCSEGFYALNQPIYKFLKDSEAFAIIKMLLDCRGLNQKEMDRLKERIIDCCIEAKQQNEFRKIIAREAQGYKGPHHGKDVIERVWALQKAMREHRIIKIDYRKLDGSEASHSLIPVGIIYNEFYFYIVAYTKSKAAATTKRAPVVFRIDRIASFEVSNVKFTTADVPIAKQCTEAEFRRRVQFMFMGELYKVTFTCKNYAVEANLDRLPTAEIVRKDDTSTTITAYVYGKTGMEMWLGTQGEAILSKKYTRSVSTLL